MTGRSHSAPDSHYGSRIKGDGKPGPPIRRARCRKPKADLAAPADRDSTVPDVPRWRDGRDTPKGLPLPGYALDAEALSAALAELADYPERIGVTVFCQMASRPAQNGQKPGPVPVWHLILTMPNPANLTGPPLRAPYIIGTGAPDAADIRRAIPEAVAGLRQLARARLADAENEVRGKPDGPG